MWWSSGKPRTGLWTWCTTSASPSPFTLSIRTASSTWIKAATRRLGLAALVLAALAGTGAADPAEWAKEFPKTDFSQTKVAWDEIKSDGSGRDTIPPIDSPRFVPAGEAEGIGPFEPVVSVIIGSDARAYPLRLLLWHEIVNDTVADVPIAVTYCPLCNSAVVFDRRLGERVLDFGNTGRIRRYDMIIYDRQTESWWQQFVGEGIVGTFSGSRLTALPARVESLSRFRERAPAGRVLVPEDATARPYGLSPFEGVDHARPPHLAKFTEDDGIAPLARVVVVEGEAWPLDRLRRERRIEKDGLVLSWEPGQNSIHDTEVIAFGRDVGNVVAQRLGLRGFEDIPYDVSFAFVFRAFHPDGALHGE